MISKSWNPSGLKDHEVDVELDDIKLLRIARLLHPDRLMELSANLVGNVQLLRELKEQFNGYKTSDYAFMILREWKKSVKNTRQTPIARRLAAVLEDLHIDKHILCQVCEYAS